MYYIIEHWEFLDTRYREKFNIVKFSENQKEINIHCNSLNTSAKILNEQFSTYFLKFQREKSSEEEILEEKFETFQRSIFNKEFTRKYLEKNPMPEILKKFVKFHFHKIGTEIEILYNTISYKVKETTIPLVNNNF